jgi:hypothetical protein
LRHTAVQIGAIAVQFRCEYPDTVWYRVLNGLNYR